MLKFILSAPLVTALSSAAFAQSVGEQTGVNSALGLAPKTEDFIKEAATSDMLEIDAAKIAQQKGNADEKQFAQQMITDHTKASSELKSLVPADMKSALPTTLDDSSQKKLDKLRAGEVPFFEPRLASDTSAKKIVPAVPEFGAATAGVAACGAGVGACSASADSV